MQQQLNKVCGSYLVKKALSNSNIYVLDGDLADSDGAEIFAESLPERFIACGIAEQNMVSVAAGLASLKGRPWVFSFAAFLCYRAYDQIRVGVSQTNFPVTLIGAHSGGCGGRNGKTHLALNDIAVMGSLPKIHIWAPADSLDTKLAVDTILSEEHPAYIRFPRELTALIPTGDGVVRWIGKATSTAIISYGLSTHWALETQKILAEEGIDIGILHFCKLWPIEQEVIDNLLQDVHQAFVVEDHYAYGGLATCLQLSSFKGSIINCAWPASWCGQSGAAADLLASCGLLPINIAEKIKMIL